MFYVSQKCHYFHFKYSLFLREFVYLKDYLFYLPTYLAFLFLFISSWKYKPPSGVLFPGERHLNFSHGRSAGNNFSLFFNVKMSQLHLHFWRIVLGVCTVMMFHHLPHFIGADKKLAVIRMLDPKYLICLVGLAVFTISLNLHILAVWLLHAFAFILPRSFWYFSPILGKFQTLSSHCFPTSFLTSSLWIPTAFMLGCSTLSNKFL